MEKNYVKTFNSPHGEKVLEHLRAITIGRFLGPNATEAELRSLEAQRALVHQIERMLARGKQGSATNKEN